MKLVVVIPSYKTAAHIVGVVRSMPRSVSRVIVVDDACPEGSGKLVLSSVKDKRVSVLFHSENQGVGGAMITGFKAALAEGADIVIKVDGDGQMDPADIARLVKPIVEGRADYAKGNRFDSLEDLEQMPRYRIFGNAVLSLMSKVSTGYWNITDPTNGFVAIHRSVLSRVHLEKLRKNFFFESDLLFRLSLIKAVVVDVAIPARYGSEKSNLRIGHVLLDFPYRHFVNHVKRVFYLYYLREWSVASVELPAGLLLFFWGLIYGSTTWITNASLGVVTPVGPVMLSAVPLILGFQLILAFISYDVSAEPKNPRQLES